MPSLTSPTVSCQVIFDVTYSVVRSLTSPTVSCQVIFDFTNRVGSGPRRPSDIWRRAICQHSRPLCCLEGRLDGRPSVWTVVDLINPSDLSASDGDALVFRKLSVCNKRRTIISDLPFLTSSLPSHPIFTVGLLPSLPKAIRGPLSLTSEAVSIYRGNK